MIRASSLILAALALHGCAMTKITCSRGECSMTVSKLGTVKPLEWEAIKKAFEKSQAARP
jgi:hypothetical protein